MNILVTERHFVGKRALKGYFELLFDAEAAAFRGDDATEKIAYPKFPTGYCKGNGDGAGYFKRP